MKTYHFKDLGVLGKEILIRGSADTNEKVQLAEVEVFGGDVGELICFISELS